MATGVTMEGIFMGDISTPYKSGNTTVDVKFDSCSYVIREDLGIRIFFRVFCMFFYEVECTEHF